MDMTPSARGSADGQTERKRRIDERGRDAAEIRDGMRGDPA